VIDLGDKSNALASLCRQFDVRRLRLFGSAATDDFDPARSDVDFLVEFEEGVSLGPWLSRLTELKDALVELVGRDIDLVTPAALRESNFRAEAEKTLTTIYEEREVAEVAR
jgi:predicted nucleotidyltransferase